MYNLHLRVNNKTNTKLWEALGKKARNYGLSHPSGPPTFSRFAPLPCFLGLGATLRDPTIGERAQKRSPLPGGGRPKD